MRSFVRYFLGSTIFTVLALGGAFAVGWSFGGSLLSGWEGLFTAFILGVLETSLSFDNAVVNAKILQNMTLFWRRMFLTLGIVIAVFGMRIVFPIVIVWAVSSRGFFEVVAMTWTAPENFQKILVQQHVQIDGFGGAFLFMVFARFFVDSEKKIHWLPGLEKALARLGRVQAIEVAITLLIALGFSWTLSKEVEMNFLTAALWGIVAYILVDGVGQLMHREDGKNSETGKIVATGLGSFLYLEVLDASFSFDGVIGSFAITDNLFLIALGLGIGAFFVRSLTIQMVDAATLVNFTFLEHGAFWAIGALALILFVGATGVEVPEVVSGSIGFLLIVLSFISSLLANGRNRRKKT